MKSNSETHQYLTQSLPVLLLQPMTSIVLCLQPGIIASIQPTLAIVFKFGVLNFDALCNWQVETRTEVNVH